MKILVVKLRAMKVKLLTYSGWVFWGLLTDGEGGGSKMAPLPKNLSHISYNNVTWHSYTLPKEDPKNIRIT